MLPTPRIIAIDDKKEELDALTEALSGVGISCYGLRYDVETGITIAFPDVRVIFFDLHLLGDAIGSRENHFNQIITCLEQIRPSGPYVIIVWSQQAHEIEANKEGVGLYDYICRRLDENLPRPYGVLKLAKAEHIVNTDGRLTVPNVNLLKEKIEELLGSHPQAKALLSWEQHVLAAASGTVSQLLELSGGKPELLKGVMASLAIAAVGKNNVDQDKFSALNEVLMPIIADRMGHLVSEAAEERVWDQAFNAKDSEHIGAEQKYKLNKFINISTSVARVSPLDRGAVIYLDAIVDDSQQYVEGLYGMALGEIITRCFGIKSVKNFVGAKWVLLQAQAACDYAQKKPQTLSYFLGLEARAEMLRDPSSGGMALPDSLWVSPKIYINAADNVLLFSAGAMVVIPRAQAPEVRPVYRLRELIMNDLLFKMRNHQSRPGIIYLS